MWQGKVAVVTGASRGLGAALAEGLARRGLHVALLARSSEALAAVAKRIGDAGGSAHVQPVDLRDWDSVDAAFAAVVDRWGRIDVLVSAAGAKRVGAVESATRADAQEALDVNYLGALACCRAAVPVMRRQGSGHIINVSSVLGKRATPARGLYSASKAALNALTDALRMEVAGSGVHVTLVCPGRLGEGPRDRVALAQDTVLSAARILECLDHPRRELVLTLAARTLVWLHVCAPGLLDRVLLWWRRRESVDRPAGPSQRAAWEEAR